MRCFQLSRQSLPRFGRRRDKKGKPGVEPNAHHHPPPRPGRGRSRLLSLAADLPTIDESEKLHRRDVEIKTQRYGPVHRETVASLAQLASTLHLRGKHCEAKDIIRQILERRHQVPSIDDGGLFDIAVDALDISLQPPKSPITTYRMRRNALKLICARMPLPMSRAECFAAMNYLADTLVFHDKFDHAEMLYRTILLGLRFDKPHSKLPLRKADCLVKLIFSLDVQAKYQEAEEFCAEAQEVAKQIDDVDRKAKVGVAREIGKAHHDHRRFEESERTLRRAVKWLERIFGDEHTLTLEALGYLSDSLQEQSKHIEAEKVLSCITRRMTNVLPENDPEFLERMDQLSATFEILSKHVEGEAVRRRKLRVMQKHSGKDDALTLLDYIYLGFNLIQQERISEAETILRQALQSVSKAAGNNERLKDVLSGEAMAYLSLVLSAQGKFQAAADMDEEVIALKKRGPEPESISVMYCMNRLAENLRQLGQYQRAIELRRDVVRMVQGGNYRIEVAASFHHDLASALTSVGAYEEAELIFTRTLGDIRGVFAEEHPLTQMMKRNLAVAYNGQRKFEDSEKLHRESVEFNRRTLGQTHTATLTSQFNLAFSLRSQGKYSAAEELLREVLLIQETKLGENHLSTIDTVTDLARAIAAQLRAAEAEPLFRRAANTSMDILGEHHPATVERMTGLAAMLTIQENHDDAGAIYKRTLELTRARLENEWEPVDPRPETLCMKCIHAITQPLVSRAGEGHEVLPDAIMHYADIVQLRYSARSCPLCREWLGAFLSLQFKRKDYHEIRQFNIVRYSLPGLDSNALQEFGLNLRSVQFVYRGSSYVINAAHFLVKLDAPPNEITSRPIYQHHLPSIVLVQQRVSQVRDWLNECLHGHPFCSSYIAEGWPTRLIDMGPVDHTEMSAKLVNTEDLDPSVPLRYAALSHCRGSSLGEEAQTTRDNEEERRKGINYRGLPRTYKEVMVTAKLMGFRYMWIDTFCIIQGDRADWAAEVANIHNIFQQCTVVLAAATSAEMADGCSLDSYARPVWRKFKTEAGEKSIEFRHNPLGSSLAPLYTRCWAFQETLLAPRLVIFTKDLFFWQCRSCSHSEDGVIDDDPVVRISKNSCFRYTEFASPENARNHWWMWILDFTARELQHGLDYLGAFAGATAYFEKLSHRRHALGLWADFMLAIDLGWSIYDLNSGVAPINGLPHWVSEKSTLPNMPSWSWYRYFNPVKNHTWAWQNPQPVAKFEELHLSWEGLPMVSNVTEARLVMCGPLTDLEVTPKKQPKRGEFMNPTETRLLCFLDEGTTDGRPGDVPFTAPCLMLTMQMDRTIRFATFLVLEEQEAVQEGRKCYRRIGIGHFILRLDAVFPFHDAYDVSFDFV